MIKNKTLGIIFLIFILFIFVSLFFIDKYFNYGDSPRDVLNFIEQLYSYFNSNQNLIFRNFLSKNYTDLIQFSGLNPSHPSISEIDDTIFFERDQYRLLYFFPLLFLKTIFINLNINEILFINNLFFVFLSITVIFLFGRKIHSNLFGFILVILNLSNYYFLQLFFSSAENYIFYYVPLFYLNMLFILNFFDKKNDEKLFNFPLIFSILLIFLNGYPNTLLSLIFFIFLFTLIYNPNNFFFNLLRLSTNILISFIFFIIISVSYSLFLGETWYFQINSVLFRFLQIYDLISNQESNVSSLSFSFNPFVSIIGVLRLIFSSNVNYISPHESGYLINKSFFNLLESFLLIVSIIFIFRISKINKLVSRLIITIFVFILIRISFDDNLVIGKSNYDYILPLIINVSLGALFLINSINNLIKDKNLNFHLNIYKLILLKFLSGNKIVIRNFEIISKLNLFKIILVLSIIPISIFLNLYLFKNTFINDHHRSIGSLNGLNQVIEFMKFNNDKKYFFNFNDYFMHNPNRILFNTGNVELSYDDSLHLSNTNYIYVNPHQITNYPLYNKFNPTGFFKSQKYYYLLPDISFKNKKTLYSLYFSDQSLFKITEKNFNFQSPYLFKNNSKILVNSNFSNLIFNCINSDKIIYKNEFKHFDNVVFDFNELNIIAQKNPFKSQYLSMKNLIFTKNNSKNRLSDTEIKMKFKNIPASLNMSYNFESSVDNVEIYFPFYFFNRENSKNELNIHMKSDFFQKYNLNYKSLGDNKPGTFRFIDGNFSDINFFHKISDKTKNFELNISLYTDQDFNDIIIPVLNVHDPQNIPFASLKVEKKDIDLFQNLKACNLKSISVEYLNKSNQNYIVFKQ